MIETRQRPVAPEALKSLKLADLHKFTQPSHRIADEGRLLSKAGAEYYPKKRSGLVIGRFQPLHYGHIYNWKMALAVSESIVIAIGSAETGGPSNPFSAHAREQMVRRALVENNLTHRVSKIVHLKDFEDDGRWLQETLAITGNVDVVVGNNEWVNEIFENAGLAAFQPPLLERGTYEGSKIREELRADNKLPPLPALISF